MIRRRSEVYNIARRADNLKNLDLHRADFDLPEDRSLSLWLSGKHAKVID